VAYTPLNPILHSQLRLAIISLLIGLESADFGFIKKETKATQGNLSAQLKKLAEANYVEVKKSFKNNYPHTTVALTQEGREAFEEYVEAISGYLKK